MTLITAIVKPFKVDDVRHASQEVGVQGMTVGADMGFGRQRGHIELCRGAEYVVDFVPTARIEAALVGDLVERAIETIVERARTGQVYDRKIFVTDLDQILRICTGDTAI